jgi:uncharacterized protein YdaU (DUF1376 family)
MKRPWMPIYWGDYLSDTEHLTQGQHGAYLLLISHYWRKGCIPDDPMKCYCIAHAMNEQEKSNVDAVLKEFFVIEGNCYRHKRIDREIGKADDLHDAAIERARLGAEYGKKSAEVRRQKYGTAQPFNAGSIPFNAGSTEGTFEGRFEPPSKVVSEKSGPGLEKGRDGDGKMRVPPKVPSSPPSNLPSKVPLKVPPNNPQPHPHIYKEAPTVTTAVVETVDNFSDNKELWEVGKDLLIKQGMNPRSAGAFIGKLCRDHGRPQVVEAVREALVNNPVDVASYLPGVLRKKGRGVNGHAGPPKTFKQLDREDREQRGEAATEMFLSQFNKGRVINNEVITNGRK